MKRRTFMSATLATAASASQAAISQMPRRTFVLQHGAWHGGWCWARVASRLRALGHVVVTPTATGLGDRSHLMSRDITLDLFVTDLVATIEAEELSDVVLVGHSFGGLAVTGAADRIPRRLRRIILLDSAILQPGESILGTLAPEIASQRRAAIRATGGVAIPAPAPSYFGVTNPADIAWLQRRLTPHPAMTYESPLTLGAPVGNGVPTTYVACTVNPLASIEPMRQWARHAAAQDPLWEFVELPTVHDAMVAAPEELTRKLLEWAFP